MNQDKPASAIDPKNLRTHRRSVKNILIHKPMQREFTFVVIVLFMISMLSIGFIIHYTIREAAFGGGFHFGKINPYEVLSDVSYQLTLWVSCILFATLMVIGFFGLFFLHRIAGPVYRFRQVFRRLNENALPPLIKLREGDFFTEVADDINHHIRRLQEQQQTHAQMKQLTDQILSAQPSDLIQSQVMELKRMLVKMGAPEPKN